jgi:asparagine synthase (glutamine-hydrolysing)
MCGLVGIVNMGAHRLTSEALRSGITAMSAALIHRGPDAGGVWVDPANKVALGHRRLSILDLTAEGAQPMRGPSGRFQLVFNGEIYNHQAISQELRKVGYQFRGHSDTEVLVTAIEEWGVTETLNRLVGMFAFAAWDSHASKLYLARDRMGEKPLYYGKTPAGILFTSELKVLRACPGWSGGKINAAATGLYLRYGYVPAPHSIYEGFYKLLPGTVLVIDPSLDLGSPNFSPFPEAEVQFKPQYYWSIAERANQLSSSVMHLSERALEDRLDRMLREAISEQMIADVPLGAFLSGGIDSSVVTAVMQSISERPVNTFTIGFDEGEFDESSHAEAVAKHLGTHHTTLYVKSKMALDIVGDMADVYDEPFADSSQIPTTLLCRLARQHVTVCLSGDGGDELFGGYNRYLYTDQIARSILPLPRAVRSGAASLLGVIPSELLYSGIQSAATVYPKLRSLNNTNIEARIFKLRNALKAESLIDVYRGLVSYWGSPSDVLTRSSQNVIEYLSEDFLVSNSDVLNQLMYWDLRTYLPDDNLVKVDRASMYSSLETRLPLLDYKIVELALSMSGDQKVRKGVTKWPLRQVLYRYVPQALIDRPKMGFSVPVAAWLRGDLREWAEELLSRERLLRHNLFDIDKVHQKWNEHLSARRDHSMQLWTILMFQLWHERWCANAG